MSSWTVYLRLLQLDFAYNIPRLEICLVVERFQTSQIFEVSESSQYYLTFQ